MAKLLPPSTLVSRKHPEQCPWKDADLVLAVIHAQSDNNYGSPLSRSLLERVHNFLSQLCLKRLKRGQVIEPEVKLTLLHVFCMHLSSVHFRVAVPHRVPQLGGGRCIEALGNDYRVVWPLLYDYRPLFSRGLGR